MKITPEQLAKSGTEDAEQRALFCWIADNQQKYPQLMRAFHIPNGGFRNIAEAAKFKSIGVRKGVLDIMLPVPIGDWHGLFIELKKIKGGVVSDEQRDWIDYFRSVGYGAIVCHGWLEARKVLIDYLEFK